MNEVIQALLTKITGIQTEVDSIKKKFNKECTSITNQLQTSANNSLDAIQNGVSGIISTLNTKANEEIEKMYSSIQAFQNAATTALTDYKTSLEGISSRFNNDIQGHVASFNETKLGFDSVLETSKVQSATLLQNISIEVAKINTEIKDYNTQLTQKVESSFKNLNTAVNLNSSKLDEIYSKITHEAENTATTSKENYIKQQQYLDGRFTGIDTKLNLQTEELKAANKNIESASAKIIKETRILLILLILGVGLSLLFNLVKFIM